MSPKDYVGLVKDILTAVEADLLDATTGQFKVQPDYAGDSAAVSAVYAAYKSHGGTTNPNTDKAVAAVVAVLGIL
jgi:hypothetical protein